jgi:hypothetical protein
MINIIVSPFGLIGHSKACLKPFQFSYKGKSYSESWRCANHVIEVSLKSFQTYKPTRNLQTEAITNLGVLSITGFRGLLHNHSNNPTKEETITLSAKNESTQSQEEKNIHSKPHEPDTTANQSVLLDSVAIDLAYGNKRYGDMTPQEQALVDRIQAELLEEDNIILPNSALGTQHLEMLKKKQFEEPI